MKLLVTMKLSNRSLLNHLLPITNLKAIENITIVRDSPGPEIDKVRYITPFHTGTTLSFLFAPQKLFQLVQLSLSEKPSLIHSYLLFPHGYLAFIAGKLTKNKVGVSLIAGPVETYIFGGSPIGKYAYCSSLPRSHILNKLILSILKRFDIITTTGSFTRNYLIDSGLEGKKIFILPHIVDDRFRPLDIKKDYDVIFVGRLAPVKHVETLIKAIAQVKAYLPSIRAVIVGDGIERNKLEELTYSLGLTDQIDFVGYQTNTWEWFNRSKISVLTSEREGFPYSVIESIKCGVPTIVSDCGDVTDVVKDFINGRVISDYNDHTAYADAIIDLLNNPALIKKYSENCLQVFDDPYSRSVESVWEDIFENVL